MHLVTRHSYNAGMKSRIWIPAVVVLALAAGGGWWWMQRGSADATSYRTAKIERGGVTATVAASGIVNPVTQVSVGTQVSGQTAVSVYLNAKFD